LLNGEKGAQRTLREENMICTQINQPMPQIDFRKWKIAGQ